MVCYDGKIEKHIILNSVDDVNSYKKEFIGNGAFGACYKYSDNKVFKETDCGENNFFDITNLTKLESDFFAFPNELVYVGSRDVDNLVGYKMDYVEGIDITNTDQEINIRDLIKASSDIEDEILKLSFNEGLRLYDLHSGNVFYNVDDKTFKIIDTDSFKIGPYYSREDNYKNNLQEWGFFLLFDLAYYYNFRDEDINNLFDMCVNGGRKKPSVVLLKILEVIEKETGKEVKTLDEFIEGTNLIRKDSYMKKSRHI